jgi:hypothetical protein
MMQPVGFRLCFTVSWSVIFNLKFRPGLTDSEAHYCDSDSELAKKNQGSGCAQARGPMSLTGTGEGHVIQDTGTPADDAHECAGSLRPPRPRGACRGAPR